MGPNNKRLIAMALTLAMLLTLCLTTVAAADEAAEATAAKAKAVAQVTTNPTDAPNGAENAINIPDLLVFATSKGEGDRTRYIGMITTDEDGAVKVVEETTNQLEADSVIELREGEIFVIIPKTTAMATTTITTTETTIDGNSATAEYTVSVLNPVYNAAEQLSVLSQGMLDVLYATRALLADECEFADVVALNATVQSQLYSLTSAGVATSTACEAVEGATLYVCPINDFNQNLTQFASNFAQWFRTAYGHTAQAAQAAAQTANEVAPEAADTVVIVAETAAAGTAGTALTAASAADGGKTVSVLAIFFSVNLAMQSKLSTTSGDQNC